MTPISVAEFMASLFADVPLQAYRVLDPGAGSGALSRAFLDRVAKDSARPSATEVTAFELDMSCHPLLESMFVQFASTLGVRWRVVGGDFIEHAVKQILLGSGGYTHAILNPPYKKINSGSAHRLALREVGIETVNLYSAFVALAVNLLEPGGQLVAIIPRSFCNGPYYRPFRRFVLDRAAIRRLHLFGSRTKAFKSDDVLQENIIIVLERGAKQGAVTVSNSTDDSFADLTTHTHPFDRIVLPSDPEYFIHVPTSTGRHAIELAPAVRYSLADLGLQISTGPVVDFRMRDHTRDMPEQGSVPLLYPIHFTGHVTEWPKIGIKKPNAIQRNRDTERWLYQSGFYCVVRRFSSKEEKRRIVASVVDPSSFPG
ncbi:MAG: Eco57I restriction-modification methylase domain-containing protein, partial [Candidatus Pacebacteria bacterium]|nr:Eco57I restriction-modification methylase domain-containing protein [Candidatus Paceibacterota bacterium]